MKKKQINYFQRGSINHKWHVLLHPECNGDPGHSDMQPISQCNAERIIPILDPYLYAGTLSAIVGAEGCGKTQLAIELGALVTAVKMKRALSAEEGQIGVDNPGKVVFIGVEDDLNSVTVPRVGSTGVNESDFIVGSSNFEGKLVERIQFQDGIRLLILDHWSLLIQGYPPGKDSLEAAISHILDLAKMMGFAILVVGHYAKSARKTTSPIHRTDMPKELRVKFRSIFYIEPIGSSFQEKEYAIISAKSSYRADVPGVVFRIASRAYNGIVTSGIEWVRFLTSSEIDLLLMRSASKTSINRGCVDVAIDFLEHLLVDGPLPYKKICAEASSRGISDASLKRAKSYLKITSEKARGAGQFSGFLWKLPAKRESDQANQASQ